MNTPNQPSAPAPVGAERRISQRFSPDPAPRCRLLPSGQAELPAVLLDLSAGGAGLALRPALPPGQGLVLRLGRPGLPPLEVAGLVVYCAQEGAAGAILGCRFMEALREDELRAVLLSATP